MTTPPIDGLVETFFIPQYRRFENMINGDGNREKYSVQNMSKGAVSWALRSGAVEYELDPREPKSQGMTLRPRKLNSKPQPQLLKKLKLRFPNADGKKLEEILALVLDDLPHYNEINDGVAQVGPWDGTWFSDTAISPQLKEDLEKSATQLEESISNCQKDWHFGGNKLVLNLVHPSLYSLNAEKTRILKNAYRPTITNTKKEYNKLLQHKVNGAKDFLPPKDVMKLLSSCNNNKEKAKRSQSGLNSKRISVLEGDNSIYLDKKNQWLPSDVYVDNDGEAHFTSYINNLFDTQVAENVEKVLSKMIPLFERTLSDLRAEGRKNKKGQQTASEVKLKGREIQVIVTMSNINLTPGRRKYPGGRLHVDGMDNEKIVAVGIFYYSCQNIRVSRLAVKDEKFVKPCFETVSLGSIVSKEGRCFVFPNNFQHKLLPFRLDDDTRPGHRKALTFFLVDPSVSIISTSRVPPQQKFWWIDQLKEIFAGILPPEIVVIIGNLCISPNYMELDKAREHRDKMAKQRIVKEPFQRKLTFRYYGN